MTITPSLIPKKKRVPSMIPIMSVLSNQIWFSKSSYRYLNNQDKVVFETHNNTILMIKTDTIDSFKITEPKSGFGFSINSRGLVRYFKEMTGHTNPRFRIKSIGDNVYDLTLIDNTK